jgi:hypothetical protein
MKGFAHFSTSIDTPLEEVALLELELGVMMVQAGKSMWGLES